MLRALRYVDHAVLCDAAGPEKVLTEYRPQVYVRGNDYIGKEMPESELCRQIGVNVVCTTSNYPRTTDILRRIADSMK